MVYKIKQGLKKEKLDFIIKYNRQMNLRIEETKKYVYALEEWEELQEDKVIDKKDEWIIKELERIKQEKIDNLTIFNKETIYKTYSTNKQIDILAGIVEYGTVEEMKEFIKQHINSFEYVKNKINNFNDLEKLKVFDEIEEYNKIIGEEDKTTYNQTLEKEQ